MPGIPEFLRHEAQGDCDAFHRLRSLEDRNHQYAQRVLLQACQHILDHGLAYEQVGVKAHPAWPTWPTTS